MTKRRILVVDDEESVRRTVARDLERGGYEVDTAESGGDAIARILESPPFDLIVTDLMMNGQNGIDVLKAAKRHDAGVAVIIITGYGALATAIEAMQAGAADYIVKPCNREEMLLRVSNCMEKRELLEQVKERTFELQKANVELQHMANQLRENNAQLERLSFLDGLTGLANRRYFDEYLRREWKVAVRDRRPLALIFIDIDFFKIYNDTFGHVQGDECLKQVAQVLSKSLKRPADLAVRYGGEEFVVLLPRTREDGAVALAEEIRVAVEELRLPHSAQHNLARVTVSLGVAAVIPGAEGEPRLLVDAADKALYAAKNEGRNRVIKSETCCAGPE